MLTAQDNTTYAWRWDKNTLQALAKASGVVFLSLGTNNTAKIVSSDDVNKPSKLVVVVAGEEYEKTMASAFSSIETMALAFSEIGKINENLKDDIPKLASKENMAFILNENLNANFIKSHNTTLDGKGGTVPLGVSETDKGLGEKFGRIGQKEEPYNLCTIKSAMKEIVDGASRNGKLKSLFHSDVHESFKMHLLNENLVDLEKVFPEAKYNDFRHFWGLTWFDSSLKKTWGKFFRDILMNLIAVIFLPVTLFTYVFMSLTKSDAKQVAKDAGVDLSMKNKDKTERVLSQSEERINLFFKVGKQEACKIAGSAGIHESKAEGVNPGQGSTSGKPPLPSNSLTGGAKAKALSEDPRSTADGEKISTKPLASEQLTVGQGEGAKATSANVVDARDDDVAKQLHQQYIAASENAQHI